MHGRLLRWLAPLLLAGTFCLASAPVGAQPPASDSSASEKGDRVPVLQYAVAVLCTIAVLVIVCKPSRKA